MKWFASFPTQFNLSVAKVSRDKQILQFNLYLKGIVADVCLLSNIIKLDGTQLVVLKVPKNTFEKIQNQCLFPNIMVWLLKIIHRPCCEQFHVGTTFFLQSNTCFFLLWDLTCIFNSFSVWLAETMRAFSPLSFLCRVLLLIPPGLVTLLTGAAAADAALLSPNLRRFAPSSDWKKVIGLLAFRADNRWYLYSSSFYSNLTHSWKLELSCMMRGYDL